LLGSLIVIEELFEACLAYIEQTLSEYGILHVRHLVLFTSEGKFKLNFSFAEFSVENGILLLELSLSEDVLDNCVQHILVNLFAVFQLMLIFVILNALIFALFLGLEAPEKESSKFTELLLEIVWSDDVQDQLDLLSIVFIDLDLIVSSLSLVAEFGLLCVVF
jgi:hypothetical protein